MAWRLSDTEWKTTTKVSYGKSQRTDRSLSTRQKSHQTNTKTNNVHAICPQHRRRVLLFKPWFQNNSTTTSRACFAPGGDRRHILISFGNFRFMGCAIQTCHYYFSGSTPAENVKTFCKSRTPQKKSRTTDIPWSTRQQISSKTLQKQPDQCSCNVRPASYKSIALQAVVVLKPFLQAILFQTLRATQRPRAFSRSQPSTDLTCP